MKKINGLLTDLNFIVIHQDGLTFSKATIIDANSLTWI